MSNALGTVRSSYLPLPPVRPRGGPHGHERPRARYERPDAAPLVSGGAVAASAKDAPDTRGAGRMAPPLHAAEVADRGGRRTRSRRAGAGRAAPPRRVAPVRPPFMGWAPRWAAPEGGPRQVHGMPMGWGGPPPRGRAHNPSPVNGCGGMPSWEAPPLQGGGRRFESDHLHSADRATRRERDDPRRLGHRAGRHGDPTPAVPAGARRDRGDGAGRTDMFGSAAG